MLPSDRFRHHVLPWDRPWVPQVAAWLAREWNGSGPLDLSRVLAIVSTRQSARRLREALAEHAARRGSAVFPPRTHTPDTLLEAAREEAGVASRVEAMLAWVRVLRETDIEMASAVFPVAPPRRDFPWAWRLAEGFTRLQSQLMEAGLSFADVGVRAGENFPERERWRQLAELEQRQVRVLSEVGLQEPHAAIRELVASGRLPTEIDRVVLLALPDPTPLVVNLVQSWSGHVPVEVVGFGPGGESGMFDEVGRPKPSAWEHRSLDIPQFERRVHLASDPAAAARQVVGLVRGHPNPDGFVALGIADPEVGAALERELSRAGIPHYNPEGRARRTERLHPLLSAMAALVRSPAFENVGALARCPDFLACLKSRYGDGFSSARFLKELDDLYAAHLPADLSAARSAAAGPGVVEKALAVMAELREVLVQEDFPEGAAAGLRLIFDGRRFDLERTDDARLAEEGEAWREIMQEWSAARALFPELAAGDGWEVALRIFGDGRNPESKAPGALELQGWLELLWEDAPHLVVAGINEGFVPDSVVGDTFLPESLRLRLGLRANSARFVRDAYLLQALAASRVKQGRLDLIFSKVSSAGDPLRPSRLLLQCEDSQLPARIDWLFGVPEAEQAELPWRRAWKLAPRRLPPPTRVPVTGLRQWLACPFRFYLKRVLQMESVDPSKAELDALDFGTLCHAALESMAREPSLRDCVDEKQLREFLLAELDRAARERFGERHTLPLVVQLESARQRLSKVASLQAEERAAGWVIQRVEWPFSLKLGGIEVRGKIDRVDRHEATGGWRVLDYKTSDTAIPPSKSHLRPERSEDGALPAWRKVRADGRVWVWTDLQLPAYVRALAAELGDSASVSCGYVNLPKAASETTVALWPEFSDELRASAMACIDGVVTRIREGDFWPPAELRPDDDDFASLFHHGAADSVTWEVKP